MVADNRLHSDPLAANNFRAAMTSLAANPWRGVWMQAAAGVLAHNR